jgi:hypothetical protein
MRNPFIDDEASEDEEEEEDDEEEEEEEEEDENSGRVSSGGALISYLRPDFSYALTVQGTPSGDRPLFEEYDDFHAQAIRLANRFRQVNVRGVLEDDAMDERLGNELLLPTIHDAGLWRVCVIVSNLRLIIKLSLKICY